MFKNQLKVALRYLTRNKLYTVVNILGLSVGITCCLLIMLFVRSEWSYDKFHSKSDRIYRAWVQENYDDQDDITNTVTPLPLAAALQSNFGEVESTCRVFNFNSLVKANESSFNEVVHMVDSTFFKVFDFEIIEGNQRDPFSSPNTVILTPEMSTKYFGNTNPIGKVLEIQLGNEKNVFTVAAIVKKPPVESSIKFGLLIPSSNVSRVFSQNAQRSWFNVAPETYVLLRDEADPDILTAKFPSMMKQQFGENYVEGGFLVNLQPITAIHLDNNLPVGLQPISNPKYSYILLTIGILILLVACINFITLSVGRSTTRAMEVGVRKVLGAERIQLVRQFWTEAILVTLVSIVIGIFLSVLFLKPFNQIINRELLLNIDFTFIGFCVLLVLIIGLIAGIYPAIVLSGFKPVEILKGKLKSGNSPGFLRKGLIAAQFVTSIGMIVCTLAIGKQLDYMRKKDLGYNKEQVVIVRTGLPRVRGMELGERYRNELMKQQQVASASVSLMSFTETPWVAVGYTDDKKVYRTFQANSVDPYFIRTMGLQMLQGRDFNPDNAADIMTGMVVNEALVKQFELKDPVGSKLPGNMDHQIIGVVKDFNFESLHTGVQPLALIMRPDTFFRRIENISFGAPLQPRISVRLKGGDISSNLALLKSTWKSVAPDQEFEYSFLDESIAQLYQNEIRISTIVKVASTLSIFIACMGLFGLATLTVARRTKEIGIRKVLGASVSDIVRMLSIEFVKLILIAALIAIPLSWWFTNDWLQDFAYRTSVSWWIYLVAGVAALLVALITVSFQAIRAAIANPVKSLRAE